MSAICQVTGRAPGFGKQVSHSHRRTSRRWDPNVQRRRYWLPNRLVLRKFDPIARQHVEFREER